MILHFRMREYKKVHIVGTFPFCFHFILLYTYTPLHLKRKYCTLLPFTYLTAIVTSYFSDHQLSEIYDQF